MSQLAQLSAAEIEARFHLTGKRPVGFLLSGFVRDVVQFSVHFAGDQFLTTLLAVDPGKGLLIFDCSGSAEVNRHLLASQGASFVGRPEGIHVQFSTGKCWETVYAGAKAFVVPLPEIVVRLQRREYFRIATPLARPLVCFGRLANGTLLQLNVHDISVAGIGLVAPALPEGLAVGSVLNNSHFVLPVDAKEMFFTATVMHLSDFEGRLGSHHWRIGLRLDDLPAGDQNRLQRYIAHIERERHELL